MAYLGRNFKSSCKECVFCHFSLECSINASLVNSAVQIFYILTGCMSTFSNGGWERNVEICKYSCYFVFP